MWRSSGGEGRNIYIYIFIRLFYKFARKTRDLRFTYTTTFDQVGNHDDYRYALLPDHSPETVERRRKRALGADVSSRPLPAIDVICIHVILTFLRRSAAAGQQLHTGVVVYVKKKKKRDAFVSEPKQVESSTSALSGYVFPRLHFIIDPPEKRYF